MCGIAGWVDFERDLTRERAIVQAMTDKLLSRGVDDSGLWFDKNVGLGHTRTAIIDPAGGIQPMIAEENGRPIAVIGYTGEAYNYRQLRGELAAKGHKFRTRSDTEVVLHSYLEWGVDCGSHLDGMFAFAVWDLRTEELVLVRDRIGIKPLFYSLQPNGILWGSEPKALLAHPAVRPVVDSDGLREMFATAKQPGQSVFRDIKEVLPGHTLTVSRKGVVDQTYWKLEAKPHTEDLPGTIKTIRTMLEDTVLQELVADVPLCVGISGGIDSSAIAAIAARWMWKLEGERLRSVTATFRGYDENFRPDDQRDTVDAPYAAELARHIKSDHTELVLDSAALIDPATRRATLLAQDQPSLVGDIDASQYLLQRAVHEHSTVVLGGEVSDEIFCGFKWMHGAEFVNADTYPWVYAERYAPGGENGQGRGLFDAGFLQKIDMAGYYADSYHQALAETPHQEGESPQEHRMREICYVHLARWLPLLLDRGDRIAMIHGLETRIPFCNHRLVEYLYNTPWAFKAFDSRDKSLLRAAVSDIVPASILERPKSPWPVTQDTTYTQALHAELAEVLADKDSPALELLDVSAVKELMKDPAGVANTWHNRINVDTAVQFNTWLRDYSVELAI